MSVFFRPQAARSPSEPHRAATPLELLFDLVSVVAIAAAAAGLHHAIAEAHAVDGIFGFLMAFFAIWWAWMNYTWFASAYDNDDTLFRLLTMLIMAGSLTMAAGIGDMFTTHDLTMPVAGYIIMRIGMTALWLRAARHDPGHRQTALRYAVGIVLVQLYWVVFLLAQPLGNGMTYGLFFLGAVLEMAVPALAERRSTTPWHRHHIMERYGLLTIIVLGETLLAVSMALQQFDLAANGAAFLRISVSALVIVFSMWWLYFAREEHLPTNDLNRALTWGYGHFVIFASGAAVGAGFAVVVDIAAHHAEVSVRTGHYAVAVPVALFMTGLWLVRDRFGLAEPARLVLPAFALILLAVPLTPFGLEGTALMTLLAVLVRSNLARAAAGAAPAQSSLRHPSPPQ